MDTRRVMVDLVGCRNVTISGIMLRDSPSWTLCIQGSESVRIENVKQICWMRNSDGVDLCNSRGVVMEGCFMRNYDDNISLKNEPWNVGDTRDITIRECVLWADCAHNFLVGPESDPRFRTDDVEFADCILLEGRETLYPYKGSHGDDDIRRGALFGHTHTPHHGRRSARRLALLVRLLQVQYARPRGAGHPH
ncbi:MAG: glycosyl hydrolase family 28 protein [Bacteroidales bacterium]|nr:MAG: glycosyl hydrolase family 28 protein [Bacteroidales bacterium]